MLVKDLMTTSISCVKEDTSLEQIARQMKQENIGMIPVCNDTGEIIGVVTDRDLVLRALARNIGDWSGSKDAIGMAEMAARDIMSTNIICASPDMSVHDASLILAKYQVRRLPVTLNNKLVGMLAMADIVRKPVYIDEAGDALSAICSVPGLSQK